MDNEEFEQDRKIEPFQLDVECARQADLFFKWAERAAEAKARADELEFAVETLEARLQLDCRENPDDYGIKTVTETAVKAAVRTSAKYVQRYQKFLAARRDQVLLDKAVVAMEMKKRMLESLISLHGQQYFAGPSTPRNLVDAWREYTEGRRERTNEKMRRKARRVRREE